MKHCFVSVFGVFIKIRLYGILREDRKKRFGTVEFRNQLEASELKKEDASEE